MNKYISLLIIPLIYSGGVFAQQQKSASYPEVDFFKNPKQLLCWSGPLSSSYKTNVNISAVPLMEYFKSKFGSARIVCKPKYGFEKWNAMIKKIKSSDSFNRVKEIAINETEQKNFIIYAFFMEYKYLVEPDEKPAFPGGKDMNFPAPIYVYQKEVYKWKLLEKLTVKSWSDYADLQMKYAKAK
ncbi:hypothetical protein [Pedobacter sp. MC2016-24]|uniref:hypothetical protein n=1 Tax=Pedobacter sp. MC2016-24 TaxID=2780090 RepID=UPI00187E8E44|nr:hypothetical protein [Pedobacter sp. MC2016-24]MBE9597973.1 hypothetical protein [Pedobacter sp. MC2016-24]